jgi:SAM-dependent methyltransferase
MPRKPKADSTYIHGSDPGEQSRLSRLNEILNAMCLREMHIATGMHILDVGCGLGQLSRMMGKAAGQRVVGIERDPRQITEARRQAARAGEETYLDIREGDVLDFPLAKNEWGTFDLVHARFVLEHVKDPAKVVAQMARAARPGGRIIISDDDHSLLRLRPEPPGARELWALYQRAYDRIGCDPLIGTRLLELMVAADLRAKRAALLNFGAGEDHFPDMVENFVGVVCTARATIVEGGLMDPAHFDSVCDAIRVWGRRPDAVIWYPLCWAEAVKPEVSGAAKARPTPPKRDGRRP